MKYRKRGEVGQVIDVKQNIAIISMTRNEAVSNVVLVVMDTGVKK